MNSKPLYQAKVRQRFKIHLEVAYIRIKRRESRQTKHKSNEIEAEQREVGGNLPNNHGILVGSFLALLSKQRSNLSGPIEEDSARNPMQRGVFPAVIK